MEDFLMKMLIATFLVLTATSLFANEAHVDWTHCKADMEKLKCHGSDKEIDECLEKHVKDLDHACAEVAEKAKHDEHKK